MFYINTYFKRSLSLPKSGFTRLFAIALFSISFFNSKAQVIFQDDFESGSLNNSWTAHPNIDGVNGLVGVFPNGEFSGVADASVGDGFFGLFLGKSTEIDEETTRNSVDLTLDLTGYDDVWLSFWIRDYRDNGEFADGLYFAESADGPFCKVANFITNDWEDEWGKFPPIPVNKLAEECSMELTSEFVIRFSQMGEGDFNFQGPEEDGIIVDNITVWNQPMEYGNLPYYEDFEENISITDANPFGLNNYIWQGWPDGTLGDNSENVINPMNWYSVNQNYAFEGNNGLILSKRHDTNQESISALDIHLNCEGIPEAVFSFMILDRKTNADFQNGVFLSVDGGETWSNTPIFEIDTSELTDWMWQEISFELVEAAAEQNMILSDSTIIRIQQIGTDNNNGNDTLANDDETDGFYIDNIALEIGYEVEVSEQFCGGTEYELPDGSLVSDGGVYETILEASNGLDSLIITTLSLFDNESYSENIALCENETYILPDGVEVSSEGTYISFLTDDNGCDYQVESTIEILNSEDVILSQDGNMISSNYSGNASYQWIDCETETEIFDANSASFEPVESGSYQLEVSDNICMTVSDCLDYSEIIDFIDEIGFGNSFLIYPNPVIESFAFKNSREIDRVEILNLLGERVRLFNSQKKYSVEELESGIYTVRIHFNSNLYASRKLIIH